MRVVVTRAAETSAELAAALRDEGFEVVECPLVGIEPISGPELDVSGYDWIVVTSRIAVEHLLPRAFGPLPPVAAIGPGTAAALRAHGVAPALVARRSTQEGLVEELPRPAGRVLFAGAEDSRQMLAQELGADFVPLYRTLALRLERFPEADLVVLASASAARALAGVRTDLPCVSIGPLTSEAAREAGLLVVSEARSHDLDGLVGAVKLAASRAGPSSPS